MPDYVADFETTTKEENCHVWAYAITEVGKLEENKEVIIGTSLDEFMEWCKNQKSNVKVYFHNLKFDSQFIFPWLFKHGFTCTEKPEERASLTFNTTISDLGMYYAIEVIFYLNGKNVKKVTFQDSLKLIPLSVEAIAESFHLPIHKGKIDYKAHDDLPEGSPLSAEEEEYIKGDVRIVAHAIDYFYSQGLNKMTIGSCALDEYKKTITQKYFNLWYPTPEFHDDVKQSYKGGFTYLNPKFAGKTLGNGIVLDVNSLYPSVMYQELLPYGTPIFFKGKYVRDEIFPLYIQTIRCAFELKKGKIPTVQIKHSLSYRGNEYLTSSKDENGFYREEVLCLTSVDLELFLDHYEVYNLQYLSGWKFKGTHGLFQDYIEKWSKNKIKAKEEGNHGLYLISKLFLNSLYGKFGTSNVLKSKVPYLGEDGAVHFKKGEEKEKDGIYIAMASFITSYARRKTITSAQLITDNYNAGKSKIQFVYADTDSLHCVSDDFSLPDGLNIHPTDLGAWDHENNFVKAKFLRQKCYIENVPIKEEKYLKGIEGEDKKLYSKDDNGHYKLKVTVAGMPTACHRDVTFRNFKLGATFTGKKQPKIVENGVILKDIDFTITK